MLPGRLLLPKSLPLLKEAYRKGFIYEEADKRRMNMKPSRKFARKKRVQPRSPSIQASPDQANPSDRLSELEVRQLNLELTEIVRQQTQQLTQLQQQLQQETQIRLQAEAELLQRIERQRLKSDIIQKIHEAFALNKVLNTAVAETQRLLQVDRVLIYRFEPDWSGTFVAEAVAKEYIPVIGSTVRDPCFASRYVEPYQQGRIQRVDDVHTAGLAACHIALLSTYQVQANLVVPIIYGGILWGLLLLHQCNQPRHWLDWEQEFLSHLATMLAISIEHTDSTQKINQLNAHLEQEVAERTAQLRLAHEFDITLKRIRDRVRDSLDETHILQTVVEELATTIGVNGCNASLYDSIQRTSTVHSEYAPFFLSSEGRVSALADFTSLYQQLQRGEACQFCFQQPNPHRGLVSILACPIIGENGVLGDLWLIHYPDYGFKESEIRLVEQVATQCAIALRQAQMFQTAQTQVKELERLNLLKDDFLSTVSHELRSPMASIKMATHLLELNLERLGVLENEPETIQKYLQILHTECQREANLINDLLDLARLDSNCPRAFTSINLKIWMPHLVESFEVRVHERHQQLQVIIPDDLPFLMTEPSYLERILTELLHNACKYTPSGERIIDKFYRIPRNDPWKHEGTGLGLALVKGLVECLGGTIRVSSENNQVEFTIQFPIPAERKLA